MNAVPIPRRRTLTLCPPRRSIEDAQAGETGCVCLHALSSFQRTDPRCALGAPGPQPNHAYRLRGRPRL